MSRRFGWFLMLAVLVNTAGMTLMLTLNRGHQTVPSTDEAPEGIYVFGRIDDLRTANDPCLPESLVVSLPPELPPTDDSWKIDLPEPEAPVPMPPVDGQEYLDVPEIVGLRQSDKSPAAQWIPPGGDYPGRLPDREESDFPEPPSILTSPRVESSGSSIAPQLDLPLPGDEVAGPPTDD